MSRRVASQPAFYVAILVIVLVGTFLFRIRTQGVFACPSLGSAADAYLGYCNAASYGEYDHGAFWYDLEPRAVQSAQSADVLFLGNSRMQFGLSAPETTKWFDDQGLHHYLMGFTFGENATFATPVLYQLHPRARVYVINVDEFFTDTPTKAGVGLINRQDHRDRYEEKRAWQRLHGSFCNAIPALCGKNIAFYRYRENGHWQVRGVPAEKPDVAADSPESEQDPDQWAGAAAIAQRFISQLPVDRSCVLLTIVPSPTTRRAEAQSIAAAVGLRLVEPVAEHLTTFDDTHLDEESAARWSSAFLQAAGSQIRQCVDAGTGQATK